MDSPKSIICRSTKSNEIAKYHFLARPPKLKNGFHFADRHKIASYGKWNFRSGCNALKRVFSNPPKSQTLGPILENTTGSTSLATKRLNADPRFESSCCQFLFGLSNGLKRQKWRKRGRKMVLFGNYFQPIFSYLLIPFSNTLVINFCILVAFAPFSLSLFHTKQVTTFKHALIH